MQFDPRNRSDVTLSGAQAEHPFNDELFENYSAEFEDSFDDFDGEDESSPFIDVDFSDLEGNDFKRNLSKVHRKVDTKRSANVHKSFKGNRLAKKVDKINSGHTKKTNRIIVPSDREVIIQGVSNFILSQNPNDTESKRIGYYKGKKLNNMTLIFNNDSPQDFALELFNPTMPLQYLMSSGLNLNDKIAVAGGSTTYSDLLFNLLANPTLIVSAQIVVAESIPGNATRQFNEAMLFKNKNIAGLQAIEPLNTQLYRDTMQKQPDILNFNIMKQLKRPFVPDGMDVIVYTILAGNTVTLNFYYKQVQIKRMVFEECRKSRNLL